MLFRDSSFPMDFRMPQTKLPKVGTTIFTVMSQLAAEHGAINLGQGFRISPRRSGWWTNSTGRCARATTSTR